MYLHKSHDNQHCLHSGGPQSSTANDVYLILYCFNSKILNADIIEWKEKLSFDKVRPYGMHSLMKYYFVLRVH